MSKSKSGKIFVGAFVVFIVAVVAFFAFRSGEKDKDQVALVVTTLSNPFFIDMKEGAEAESATQQLKLVVQAPDLASDVERQIAILENLIAQRIDVICLVPADSKAVIPAIAKAEKAGVRVINIDNRIDVEALKKAGVSAPPYIGSDNRQGGVQAGEYLAKLINEKGKVAILEGVSGVEAGILRKEGFLEAIAKYPQIEVVASQPADWSREKGLNVFQSIYQAHPDLAGLFACNDEMALGAIQALGANRSVKVVGFDATDDARKAVKEGRMDATVAQQPREMAILAIKRAAQWLGGEKPAVVESTPLQLVTE